MIEEPAAAELLDRLVRSVAAIPDPIVRARECVNVGDEVRGVHSRLADVRRKAIYEATLRPGATGRSVSEELGVSAKTVSLASSEFRREDLALLRRLIDTTKTVVPGSADVAHAEAMAASSPGMGVLAHVVAGLCSAWLEASSTADEGDAWEETYEGFKRAEYLSRLVGLQRPTHHPAGGSGDVDEHVPARLRWPCRVMNVMPGISAWGSVEDRGNGPEWTLWWSIESADRHLDIGDVGPSREGWLVSEWLVWLVRDYRIAGKHLESRVTAPPPMLNEPGGMMTFCVDGPLQGLNAVDPHEFARSIMKLWDGDAVIAGSGYFDVDWPQEVA